MTSVELRRTKWPLFRCFESAVLPSRLVRFHRVVDRHFVEVIALRAFKSPQFGMGRTWFNVRQHQATLTFGGNVAARSEAAMVRNKYEIQACECSLRVRRGREISWSHRAAQGPIRVTGLNRSRGRALLRALRPMG
jgi:hypothetical protein